MSHGYICDCTQHNYIHLRRENISNTSVKKLKDKLFCSNCGDVIYV